MAKIYPYVIRHDYGFAPNPYGGFCTLATCKPQIRKKADSGDWLLGVGSVGTTGRNTVVYAALIDQAISIEVYGADSRFAHKRPEEMPGGDNIYYKDETGIWKQRWNNYHQTEEDQCTDLSGKNVLIAKVFWYFGSSAPKLPESLMYLISGGRALKHINNPSQIVEFENWLRRYPQGINGKPYMLPKSPRQQLYQINKGARKR